jgi:hypothetical protein
MCRVRQRIRGTRFGSAQGETACARVTLLTRTPTVEAASQNPIVARLENLSSHPSVLTNRHVA